jgi:predicted ABC-type ATPase
MSAGQTLSEAGRPWVVILGGINGAGKSTTATQLARTPELAKARILNPDTIAAEIIALKPHLGSAAANFAALRRVAEAIAQLIRDREPFLAETVLANRSYRQICRDAMHRGMFVRLVFVALPTVDDAIERVAVRVAKGGHAVPEADIRRRWPLAHQNLAWFAQCADAVDVFANRWEVPPTLIARARAGRVALIDADTLPAVTAVLRPLL